MKILVITFAKGINPGCYMQALGVYKSMKSIWPDAEIRYMRFENFKRNIVPPTKESIKDTFLRKAYSLSRIIKYARNRKKWFVEDSKFFNLFNPSNEEIAHLKEFDLIVIGSDTILEKAFDNEGNIGLNWMPLEVPKIYFAASASPAKFSTNNELKLVAERAIFKGLRDSLTMNLFKERLGLEPSSLTKQPDATYHLDVNDYELPPFYAAKLKKGKKYVLCNLMHWFPYIDEVKDLLHKYGYSIVTTEYRSYADVVLASLSAEEWAAVFKHMSLVFTERFHDSVFALRNCVPVINIDWEKSRFDESGDSKTIGILSDYDMERFHINLKSKDDLEKIEDIIANTLNTFDKSAVAEYNALYINKTSEILSEIKSLYESHRH